MSRSRSNSYERDTSRRSRSRSGSRTPPRRSRRSRSRSRSPAYRHGGGGGRRGGAWAHNRSRENPDPNRCVGVFNLSLYTTEKDLRDVFGKFGEIDKVDLVYDHPTGRSRGFGFIYFEAVEDATAARDELNGSDLDGHKIRVDYSITTRAHTPTPGQYMGREGGRGGHGGGRPPYRDRFDNSYRRRESYRDGYYRDNGYGHSKRRSPSPRRSYRRSPSPRRRSHRSRSRSYD